MTDQLATPAQPPTKIIDLQLPLTWLLSSVAGIIVGFAGVVWAVAGQTNKLDQLIASTAKLEKRVDDRDSRVETMKDAQYEARRQQDLLEQRVAALERGMHK